MVRRLVISVVLAVILIVLQLVARNPVGVALLTGLIAFAVAFLVLLVSDRWFTRSRRS